MFRLTSVITLVLVNASLLGVLGSTRKPLGDPREGAVSQGTRSGNEQTIQAPGVTPGPGRHTCSTFLLPAGDTLVVGHNLDEYFDVPGAVVVNKRGVQKESISWEDDLYTVFGKSRKAPGVRWISKYGSITYNTEGKEFPDGGMNEAGLYVGEMSLTKVPTERPVNHLPKIYPRMWMQYLLDSFASVDEVIGSLETANPGGPQKWHFFISDRQGNVAGIEFLEGKTVIYRGETMPIKVMTNPPYAYEMEKLKRFRGFGGREDVDLRDRSVYNGFVWAASLINAYPASGATDPVAYAFDILHELEWDNNQWAVVYDVTRGRMYFRTAKAHRIRFVDFSAFDFSCATPTLMLDITQDLEGDVAGYLAPYTEARNKEFIRRALAPYNLGVPKLLSDAFKLLWGDRLHNYTRGFTCAK